MNHSFLKVLNQGIVYPEKVVTPVPFLVMLTLIDDIVGQLTLPASLLDLKFKRISGKSVLSRSPTGVTVWFVTAREIKSVM